MDRTEDLSTAVINFCNDNQEYKGKALSYRSEALLKRHPVKASAFIGSALQVGKDIDNLRGFIRDHQDAYVGTGQYTGNEKNRIEEEVSLFVRASTQQIDQLKEVAIGASEGPDSLGVGSQAVAHYHGVVLILVEQLARVTRSWDKCRAVRYRRDANKERLEHQRVKIKKVSTPGYSGLPDADGLHDHKDTGSDDERVTPQKKALIQENKALMDELHRTEAQAQEVEKTVREISTLNQLLSAAVISQAEAIEQLYTDAVAATVNITRGNEEIKKTIDVNKSSRKYLVVLLVVATLALLFFDWFNS